MARYIDAEIAEQKIKGTFLGTSGFAEDIRNSSLSCINSVPAADVQEVRKGEWKLNQTDGGALGICSCCKWPVSWWSTSKFCPNCGAKMEVE